MTNLEENINHYMELKGIKFYTDLLVDIAHELNIKGKDAYEFAKREKANFITVSLSICVVAPSIGVSPSNNASFISPSPSTLSIYLFKKPGFEFELAIIL